MVSAAEGANAKAGAAANLAVGLDALSLNDTVTFTRYAKLVLPLDGYVFWVKADLVKSASVFNGLAFNDGAINSAAKVVTPALTLIVKGSLHYSTTQAQNESETEGTNVVTFTAQSPVQEFNDVAPNEIWIGEYAGDREGDDGPITFAFSQRGKYYKAADLFHYVGIAVLPVFKTQIIDKIGQLSTRQLIVSNSLPIWLALSNYTPPYDGFNNIIPLYPSFILPDNLPPPYGAVHIVPEQTNALQEAPYYDASLNQSQLARDLVRVTLYGCNNAAAQTFLSAIEQYSFDTSAIGLMNMPIVRDEKRTQSELTILAQKKTIEFEVSYLQGTARNVARAFIESCVVDYQPSSAV